MSERRGYDPEYEADEIDPDTLTHPRGRDRFNIGMLGQGLEEPHELLADITWLLGQVMRIQGGGAAGRIGRSSSRSANTSERAMDLRPLAEAREVERVVHRAHVELARLKRRLVIELLGPQRAGIVGSEISQSRDETWNAIRMALRDEQVRRIRDDYPSHWRSGEIAIVEECSERWVRQLRGSDRDRKAVVA